MRKSEVDDRSVWLKLIKNSLVASLAVLLCGLIVMFIVAVMAERGGVTVDAAETSSVVVIIILAFLGAIITVKRQGGMTLIAGLSVSAMLLLLLLLLGIASFGGSGAVCMPMLVGIPLAGGIAGLIGGKKRKIR